MPRHNHIIIKLIKNANNLIQFNIFIYEVYRIKCKRNFLQCMLIDLIFNAIKRPLRVRLNVYFDEIEFFSQMQKN